MKTLVKMMKALSDPNRIRIVKLLAQRELCVCEVQELLGLAQSTVSKHLKILEESGFAESRKEGSWINYRLSDDTSAYATELLAKMREWQVDDPALEDMLVRLPLIDRAVICTSRQP